MDRLNGLIEVITTWLPNLDGVDGVVSVTEINKNNVDLITNEESRKDVELFLGNSCNKVYRIVGEG